MGHTASYLLIISEAQALRWIVSNRRMAFAAHRTRDAGRIAVGDRLLMFTTRGCFHNPTRDRSRLVGEAEVSSAVTTLDEPLEIAGRQFASACDLALLTLARLREGCEFAPLVKHLSIFPDERSWPVRLRRTLVSLPTSDAELLRHQLYEVVEEGEVQAGSYH
jgi:hypothetical protein